MTMHWSIAPVDILAIVITAKDREEHCIPVRHI